MAIKSNVKGSLLCTEIQMKGSHPTDALSGTQEKFSLLAFKFMRLVKCVDPMKTGAKKWAKVILKRGES